jgi:NAD(P)-dependent dehydrogenase (short-subunit alcohol dehydrogenase family)
MSQRVTALVTGAARGIGSAIARALAEGGFDVAVLDVVDAAETVEHIREAGGEGLSISGSVSSAEDRADAIRQVRERFGRLDCLVNNAGVAPRERLDILDATEESYDRVMEINLKGPYFLTQLAARWMIDQHADDGRRRSIVNIASLSSYAASPSRGEYCLSKAGVSMATKLWAARLAEHGVGVYEVRPGIIETDMTSAVREKYDRLIAEGLTPIRRWGRPGDVAAAVAACAEGKLAFSTGEVLNVDGGFHLRTL